MNKESLKTLAASLLKKWWASLLLLPFVVYSIHQCYRVLRFNIFFSISYDFPFPISWIYFLLDNFLLIVHEAGHTFFGILGSRMISILGGSLFEVLLPLMILVYSWVNRLLKGMQFSFFLVGFSLMSVAFYAADANERQLPLIGGLSKESHDWYNLLSRWNLLDHDLSIAIGIASAGIVCYIAALLLPAFSRNYRQVDIDLDI